MKEKQTTSIDNSEDFGVKIRAFDGSIMHERFCSGLDKSKLNNYTEELSKLPITGNVKIKKEKKINRDFETKAKIDPNKVPLKTKVATCDKYLKKILSKSKKLTNCRVLYRERNNFKIFVNPSKKLSQNLTGVNFLFMPLVTTKDRETRYQYDAFFGPGFEVTKISEAKINRAVKLAIEIITAKKIPHGKYHCILAPVVSGLLAHESFGHGMEADTIYKNRAKAKEFIGKPLAAKFISIADGAHVKNKHGSFFFDDEGALSSETTMINKGVVASPLTDSHTAWHSDYKKTANGRCESYDHKAYARMTNTYFKAGKTPVKNMFKGIKQGIFLFGKGGGMEDPKGWGVQLNGVLGREIKNGKLTKKLYYAVGVTGYLPRILKNIEAASKEFEIPGTGFCGKGHKEWVQVSEGGCYLKIKDLELA